MSKAYLEVARQLDAEYDDIDDAIKSLDSKQKKKKPAGVDEPPPPITDTKAIEKGNKQPAPKQKIDDSSYPENPTLGVPTKERYEWKAAGLCLNCKGDHKLSQCPFKFYKGTSWNAPHHPIALNATPPPAKPAMPAQPAQQPVLRSN